MDYLIIGILSYLLGSIPFGYLLTKFFLKKDIRDVGSGNIGATNALRSGNKLIGYLTLVFDIGKAVIPVLFVKINYPELIFLSSLCAFLGHVFPLWLKFKGGKGVATYLGILFVINISYGIIFITIWLFIYFLSKYSSLSSILATLSIPIFLVISKNFSEVSFFVIMFVLIFFTHRENIKRLKNKEEKETKIY
ncbi:glycerol-3-phosphate 1-O-acyltransferase PlsY [Candidatus Pelagibacter sp.]|jgi:glycerol-3-phosphate acyltransferase PlsY|uniref:glycerol-3-phosphate 1-O-acyltransferase PlsY n=1 Tax=Candidatus Pelagibacter sp. TaxID=2024849 RepID=UPI00027E4FF3|nr:acyl-phosphate glycerol-3-phosphate acyltransferase [alpha proteobacterium HIMB5]REK51869.1 MAG: glycerol-3-phosphate 1-O-acyltransferase [Pseudomonadota bacterium]|tara:strand:+ start:376 stop:954 length:579 start_codon:yes stop_codon:yes gene_type:complete